MKYFDRWSYLTCKSEEEFPTRAAAIEHMTLVHGYKLGTPAVKNLVVHLDFDRGWQSNYDWDFGSFKMLEMTGASRK